jgi:sigma-B regulation protein RsbU (phosphoserine phosphatase)
MSRPPESVVPRPLIGLVVALCVANALFSVWGNLRLYQTTGNAGFLPSKRGLAVTVGQVRPDGPAVALESGDEILALGGRESRRGVASGMKGQEDVFRFFAGRPPGPYAITLRRDGRVRQESLDAPPYRWGWTLSLGVGRLAIHLLFALSGLALALLRPESKAGLLLTLAFALFIPGDMLGFATEHLPPLVRALYLGVDALSLFFWPVLLHFFLVFPEPIPLLERRPSLEKLLYVPTLAVFLVLAPVQVLQFSDPDLAFATLREAVWLRRVMGALWVGSTALGLLVLVANYVRSGRAARRRLRVAVAGALAGFFPLLVLMGSGAFAELQRLPIEVTRGLSLLCLVTLPLVPLAFGYAILRHDVIPLRVLLRRGLRYLLVSRGVIVLEALLVLGLVAFALTGSRGRFVDGLGPRADILVALVVGSFGMLVLHRQNRRVRGAIDRRFFREAYDARRVLTSLSEAVREVKDAPALVGLVAGRVRDALYPECVRLYLREQESDRFLLSHPFARELEEAPRALVDGLSGMDHAVGFSGSEPGPGGIILAFAMRGRRDLQGILGLGPRLGDLPYTREDRELLRSVASQAGLSLENGGLMKRIAQQERVAHELSIAAEVQRRLFPDRAPAAEGLDLAGVCVPAGDVGGDYYDFMELPGGQVAFAVADVAGKGLPAALLMSMVQASLRSQGPGERSLSETCDAMNRLLYRSTAPNAYATFFYGVFENGPRRLRYVNAGHNPPLVVRAPAGEGGTRGARVAAGAGGAEGGLATAAVSALPAAEESLRLRATGLVLGALADSPYAEESLELEPGDIVVAYTDGVSEAFGPGGEEFGEDRLSETVAASRSLPAAAIVERVSRAVAAWRGSAAAHDDFTLVVARVL